MPTIDERLQQIRSKLERANKHLIDLDFVLQAFDASPHVVGAKRDPNTRKLVYYIDRLIQVPEPILTIAGDTVCNLRGALDYLAYQVVCSDTLDRPPNRAKIYFPLGDNPKDYESAKIIKMKGAKPDTFTALDLLKPYKGGTDLLWIIQHLNNIEKHRLLERFS